MKSPGGHGGITFRLEGRLYRVIRRDPTSEVRCVQDGLGVFNAMIDRAPFLSGLLQLTAAFNSLLWVVQGWAAQESSWGRTRAMLRPDGNNHRQPVGELLRLSGRPGSSQPPPRFTAVVLCTHHPRNVLPPRSVSFMAARPRSPHPTSGDARMGAGATVGLDHAHQRTDRDGCRACRPDTQRDRPRLKSCA